MTTNLKCFWTCIFLTASGLSLLLHLFLSSHDFSFVLAKFYEMEDIIATTTVNTVTEEIFCETKFGGFIREEHFLLGEKNATCSLKFGRYFSNSLKSLDKHGLAGSVTNNL